MLWRPLLARKHTVTTENRRLPLAAAVSRGGGGPRWSCWARFGTRFGSPAHGAPVLSCRAAFGSGHPQSHRPRVHPGPAELRAGPGGPGSVQRSGTGNVRPQETQVLRRGAEAAAHDQEGSQGVHPRGHEGEPPVPVPDPDPSSPSSSPVLTCPCSAHRTSGTGPGAGRTTWRPRGRGTPAG